MKFPSVATSDDKLHAMLRDRVDALAKPPGSLGRMEDLAVRVGAIKGTLTPKLGRACAFVFAGDHGLTEEGVSRYPSHVTTTMVETFLAGRASANAFARAVGAEVKVVDAGVKQPLGPNALRGALIDAAVRRGTGNAAREPAMTSAEVETALGRGIGLAQAAAEEGFDILVPGEMGIGNTASAALLMHRLASVALAQCVGRGAGHDDAGLARKLAVLERAAARTSATAPLEVLAEFGGCEIVMMAGFIIGAAASRCVVVVDGFISTCAALAAIRLVPAVRGYCIFSHRSAESGHSGMLAALDAEPLLDLDMRLGEGTGALLAVPLIRAAAAILSEVALLEEVVKAPS